MESILRSPCIESSEAESQFDSVFGENEAERYSKKHEAECNGATLSGIGRLEIWMVNQIRVASDQSLSLISGSLELGVNDLGHENI